MDLDHNRKTNGDGMVGVIASCGLLLHSLLARLGRAAAGFAGNMGEIAREDPRRVAHSLKVGLALALVSVVYFVTALFNGLGVSPCGPCSPSSSWSTLSGEPISLTVFVFLVASAATFLRFIPEIKAKYDYGVTIFILTFSLVAVSSYRVEELIQLAHDRFYTIVVGVVICLLTTVFVFPV
ncbi:hypothetical protein ACQ4PT_050731 [Festuca glaucescens]